MDGTWSARLPALQARLRLDSGRLGLAVFVVSGAATALLPLAGWLSARLGSRLPCGIGIAVAAAGLTAAAFAPSFGALLPLAALLGAGWSVVDVAANAQGLAVEQRAGRPLLSAFHGTWSLGLLAGSGVAAGAAAAGVGPRLEFPLVAAAALALGIAVLPRLVRGTRAAADVAHVALPRGALALPALLMLCSVFAEGAMINWSAVFLRGPAGASAAVAAGGVVAFSGATVAGRFVGDRLLLRWRVEGLALRGGILTAAGVVLAVATRSPAPALLGFACVGLGCAAIVPALFRVGGSTPGVAPGAGVAAVATAGYTGSVITGPSIGFLARGVGLSAAMLLVAAAGALIAVLGPKLGSRA